MDESKFKEIEYWISCEIRNNNEKIRQQYLIDKGIRKGFTSMQVLSVLDHVLLLGIYYEPNSGLIAKVPNSYLSSTGRART